MSDKIMHVTKVDECRKPEDNKIDIVREERIGRLSVSRHFIENAHEDVWRLLMMNFRIVDAYADRIHSAVEYVAYSPLFDKLSPGEFTPKYNLSFSRNERNGTVSISKIEKVQTRTQEVEDVTSDERLARAIQL